MKPGLYVECECIKHKNGVATILIDKSNGFHITIGDPEGVYIVGKTYTVKIEEET